MAASLSFLKRLSMFLVAAMLVVSLPARVYAQQVEYYHLDALGSVRAVTDENGAVITRHDYMPYGGEWNAPPSSDTRRFTGKERDSETNLDYFGARYYGAALGTFAAADPAMTVDANLTDPQRWNRYAYARGNPLVFVDPDGREILYGNDQIRGLFNSLSQSSETVRRTLSRYHGRGRDLIVVQGDAGRDVDGTRANGNFSGGAAVFYGERASEITQNTTPEQLDAMATRIDPRGKIVLDSSLTISVFNDDTVRAALHELGHAEQNATFPLQYERDKQILFDSNGQVIDHDLRPVEIFANQYRDRAAGEIRRPKP